MSQKPPHFDAAALDELFTNLLGPLGASLDEFHRWGWGATLPPASPLRCWAGLAQEWERELLVQWKIRQDQGMEALTGYQARWLLQTLRLETGVFAQWAGFRQALVLWHQHPGRAWATNPWHSCLLWHLVDPAPYQTLSPDSGQALARFWQALLAQDVEHQFTSLLNLVELGAKRRPDPPSLGQLSPQLPPALEELCQALLNQAEPWPLLQAYWQRHSGGWAGAGHRFVVLGEAEWRITPPRAVAFADLHGIAEQAQALRDNLTQFLQGQPARHCLLWGDRGTGKTSSIHALLGEFAAQGLKLVELDGSRLGWLPSLFAHWGGLPEPVMLLIDEIQLTSEPELARMKTWLDRVPRNVLLLATSNKKDLAPPATTEQLYPWQRQLLDAQRALDDRFALKLHYPLPQFEALQEMFRWAAQRAGKEPTEELWLAFRQFAALHDHDHPNGRTLAQFFGP